MGYFDFRLMKLKDTHVAVNTYVVVGTCGSYVFQRHGQHAWHFFGIRVWLSSEKAQDSDIHVGAAGKMGNEMEHQLLCIAEKDNTVFQNFTVAVIVR